jgi:hypothetical protein
MVPRRRQRQTGSNGVVAERVDQARTLEDDARRLGVRVAHDVEQVDHVDAAPQTEQDRDLALDLLLLDRLERLEDYRLRRRQVDALEDLSCGRRAETCQPQGPSGSDQRVLPKSEDVGLPDEALVAGQGLSDGPQSTCRGRPF